MDEKPGQYIDSASPFCRNCTRDDCPTNGDGCKDARGNYRRFQGRKERDQKTRSKTFPGVAKAMAEQWGGDVREET